LSGMAYAGKHASIDIGTNSTLLLVAGRTSDNRLEPIVQYQRTTRLGRDLQRTGEITSEAVYRTCEVLAEYRKILESKGVDSVSVCGTAVFRDAVNGDEALQKIAKASGYTVHALSGEEEARLSFAAACQGLAIEEGPVLLADIGGGSTECILGQEGRVTRTRSFPLGAVTLTDKFRIRDRVAPDNYQALQDHIADVMSAGMQDLPQPVTLVGVAGTVTTLATIDLYMDDYDPEQVHGHRLNRESLAAIQAYLQRLPLAERMEVTGLYRDRADIIMAGLAVLQYIMSAGKFDSILVSDRGLRYGMILQELGLITPCYPDA